MLMFRPDASVCASDERNAEEACASRSAPGHHFVLGDVVNRPLPGNSVAVEVEGQRLDRIPDDVPLVVGRRE